MAEGSKRHEKRCSRRGARVNYSKDCTVSGLTCQLPQCGISLNDEMELEAHHKVHLAKLLENLSRVRVKQPPPLASSCKESTLHRMRSTTYARLRERRLRRAMNVSQPIAGLVCQLCQEMVLDNVAEHSVHVRECIKLARKESLTAAGPEDEEDGWEEEVEEYEWAGQSRIRASSLLSRAGGFSAAGFQKIQRTDETEELDVTGDSTLLQFGETQFTEDDLLQASTEDDHLQASTEDDLTETSTRLLLPPPMGDVTSSSVETLVPPQQFLEPLDNPSGSDQTKASHQPPIQIKASPLDESLDASSYQPLGPQPHVHQTSALESSGSSLFPSTPSHFPLAPSHSPSAPSHFSPAPSYQLPAPSEQPPTPSHLPSAPSHQPSASSNQYPARLSQLPSTTAYTALIQDCKLADNQVGTVAALAAVPVAAVAAPVPVPSLSKEETDDRQCRVCLGGYRSPLVCTVCWHVHCHKCWMLTLSTKKLCPQCKTIVTPADLRKIFL